MYRIFCTVSDFPMATGINEGGGTFYTGRLYRTTDDMWAISSGEARPIYTREAADEIARTIVAPQYMLDTLDVEYFDIGNCD